MFLLLQKKFKNLNYPDIFYFYGLQKNIKWFLNKINKLKSLQ